MSAGLLGLLDDIAAIAKAAAASLDDVAGAASKATAKAAGVVIDDTAVAPQFVSGVTPDRELPIVKKIAVGSVRNKLLLILPVVLLLSWLAPWALSPILMAGGTFLCYEGAHKVWERLRPHAPVLETDLEPASLPVVVQGEGHEKRLVNGAIRTDLILSAEIMVIAFNEVAHESLWQRAVILIIVALVITAGVYGVVAVIVKMDDMGLALARRDSRTSRRLGRGMVVGMPKVLAVLATVGTAAMLWVGGHILISGAATLGWSAPRDLVHHLTEPIAAGVPGVGGVLAWAVDTGISAAVGLAVGIAGLYLLRLVPYRRAHKV